MQRCLADTHLADAERSRRWNAALVAMALAVPGNGEVVGEWAQRWVPLGDAAIEAYPEGLPGFADGAAQARAALATWRQGHGPS